MEQLPWGLARLSEESDIAQNPFTIGRADVRGLWPTCMPEDQSLRDAGMLTGGPQPPGCSRVVRICRGDCVPCKPHRECSESHLRHCPCHDCVRRMGSMHVQTAAGRRGVRGEGGKPPCKRTSLQQTSEAQGGVPLLLPQRLSEDVMELLGCNVRVAARELVICQ